MTNSTLFKTLKITLLALLLVNLVQSSLESQHIDTLNSIIETMMEKSDMKLLFKTWHFLNNKEKEYDYNSEYGIQKFKTFKENVKEIKRHNSQEGNYYKKGINHLTDMTNEEVIKYYNLVENTPSQINKLMKDFSEGLKNDVADLSNTHIQIKSPPQLNNKRKVNFDQEADRLDSEDISTITGEDLSNHSTPQNETGVYVNIPSPSKINWGYIVSLEIFSLKENRVVRRLNVITSKNYSFGFQDGTYKFEFKGSYFNIFTGESLKIEPITITLNYSTNPSVNLQLSWVNNDIKNKFQVQLTASGVLYMQQIEFKGSDKFVYDVVELKNGTYYFPETVTPKIDLDVRGYKVTTIPSPLIISSKITNVSIQISTIFKKNPIDWTSKQCGEGSCVTPVRHQLSCGSCWAFASMGAVESLFQIKNQNQLPDFLSTQQLVDCDYMSNGCNGGLPLFAMEFLMKNNVCFDNEYPYAAAQRRRCASKSCSGGIIVKEVNLAYKSYEIYNQLLKGPTSVTIDPTVDFYAYKSGIFNGTCSTNPKYLHAVLLVGYGIDPVLGGYWIIKNSWGTQWGMAGYINVLDNNSNSGSCLIENSGTQPIIK